MVMKGWMLRRPTAGMMMHGKKAPRGDWSSFKRKDKAALRFRDPGGCRQEIAEPTHTPPLD
jgi:hypothetical protein